MSLAVADTHALLWWTLRASKKLGRRAREMFARVEPVLRKLPIGQNARVVVRHGKAGQNAREVRMPRR